MDTPRPINVAPTAADRRVAPRHKVLKAAKLVAPDAWVFIDGTLRDLSDTGAKIMCAQPKLVPDDFRLLTVSDNTIRPCHVVWHSRLLLGVRFTGEERMAPPRKF